MMTPPALSLRTAAVGAVLGAVLAAAGMYTASKTPGADQGSIPAALVGFAILSALARRGPRPTVHDANLIQTIASTAAMTAITGGVSGPITALVLSGESPPLAAITAWCAAIGAAGCAFAVPLRRAFVVTARLPFPSAVATAEVITAIASGARSAGGQLRALAGGTAAAGALAVVRDLGRWIPSMTALPSVAGLPAGAIGLGVDWSPLLLGTGVLMGARTGVAMLLGTAVAYLAIAPSLVAHHIVAAPDYAALVTWLLWPGIGLMIGGMLSGAIAGWRTLVAGLRNLGADDRGAHDAGPEPGELGQRGTRGALDARGTLPRLREPGEFDARGPLDARSAVPAPSDAALNDAALSEPALSEHAPSEHAPSEHAPSEHAPRGARETTDVNTRSAPDTRSTRGSFGRALAITSVVVLAVAIAGRLAFGIHPALVVLALVLAAPLCAAAARATGETDNTPAGALGGLGQLAVAAVAPGSLSAPLAGGAVVTGCAMQSSVMLGNWKTGEVLGTPPRPQLIGSLVGVAIGAVAATLAFELIRRTSGFGNELMPAPSAQSWRATALVLQGGLEALPAHAAAAAGVAVAAGIVLGIAARSPRARAVPSPFALGIAFIIPPDTSITIALGAIAVWLAGRRWRRWTDGHATALASGAIAGEAVVGLVLAGLRIAGVLAFT